MIIKELITVDNAWLIDDRYEVHLRFNHGYCLEIFDKDTLVKVLDWRTGENGEDLYKEVPQSFKHYTHQYKISHNLPK
jgi:hypothetical protein